MTSISVGLPTYNGARFVRAAVDSILSQAYTNFNLVVSDDASQDGCADLLAPLVDDRMRIVRNPNRLGLVANWNRCLELASGEYMTLFHQDDLMLAGHLQHSAAALDAHPHVGFVFSNITTIDSQGKTIGGHWTRSLPKVDTIFKGCDFFNLLLDEGNVVPCQTVVMRTSLVRDVGLFDSRLHYTPDLEMWLRLALHADAAYLAQPLVALRRHAGQESTRFVGRIAEVEEVWRAIRIVFSENRQYMRCPEDSFDIALRHLIGWSQWLTREAACRGQVRRVVSLVNMMTRFSLARHRGLAKLRVPAEQAER